MPFVDVRLRSDGLGMGNFFQTRCSRCSYSARIAEAKSTRPAGNSGMETSRYSGPFSETRGLVIGGETRWIGEVISITLAAWFQPGELRRFSVVAISERGRGSELDILFGDGELVFASRKGCT